MKITRNGVEYKLTNAELEAAFREQQHNYQLEDAKAQFEDYCQREFWKGEDDEAKFAEVFGFSMDDVSDPSFEHYLLEKFVVAYEKSQSCECADNDIWQEVIRNVLIDNAKNFKVFFQVSYYVQHEKTNGGFVALPESCLYMSLEKLHAAQMQDGKLRFIEEGEG